PQVFALPERYLYCSLALVDLARGAESAGRRSLLGDSGTMNPRVTELRNNVVSLQRIIEILPSIVQLCMFTLTATALDPAGVAIAHVQPTEGMER
ncbi:MAG TPA: hypothetical protein VE650_14050, partial [Acetobacteraceae bacterium]|nr:hypothetical protein [Acetobacteraceae bacterium]